MENNKLDLFKKNNQGMIPIRVLTGIIQEAYGAAGIEIKPVKDDVFDIAVKYLMRDLQGTFSDMTADDIREAFRKGVKGDYGDYMGINYASLFYFIQQYAFAKRKAISQQVKPHELPAHIPTNRELLNQYYRAFLQGNTIIWCAGHKIYDLLEKEGIINPSDEEIAIRLETARSQLKQEACDKKQHESKGYKRNEMRDLIEQLSDREQQNDKVLNRAKSNIAKDYFNSIKQNKNK